MAINALEELAREHNLIQWALSYEAPSEPCQVQINNLTLLWLADGILEIRPTTETSLDVVISCGVHGNETAPIEMTEQLFSQIIRGEILLSCRLLIILGNLPAMKQNKRFCEENLNRLFSGKHRDNETGEGQRAAVIEQHVERFFKSENVMRVHLDLHTAIRGSIVEKFAIYPYRQDGIWNSDYLNWLAEADIQAVLLGHQPSGTFSYYTSAKFNAMAFTVELGKALAFGQNDHSTLKQFKHSVSTLLEGKTTWRNVNPETSLSVYQVVDEVLRQSDADFVLHLSDDFKNFSTLNAGYQLTSDSPDNYHIKDAAHRIVFPNKNVPSGQRVALVIEPYDIRQIQ